MFFKTNSFRIVSKLALCFLVFISLIGCAADYERAADMKVDSNNSLSKPEFSDNDATVLESPAARTRNINLGEKETSLPASLQEKPAALNRKIIYQANVSLVVSEFDGLNESIEQLVSQNGGIIASHSVNNSQDRQRYGNWQVRIPAGNFKEFFNDVQDLGVPIDASRDSEDVTEQFVDLQARITSKKKLEQRVLKLLERGEDRIQQVIEVERELGRIRSEIERMEGRLRYLSDRIDLSTISITAREERDYTPAQAPTLGNRISSTWGASLENFQKFWSNMLVWLIGASLWLMVWGLLLIVALLTYKAWTMRRSSQTAPATD